MSGTALDPSIPLNAGKTAAPPVNALAQMGQIMQLRQMQQQNALFPGQQQLQQNQITGTNLANQTAQLGLTRAANTAVNGFLGPAVAKGGAATLDDYTTALARAHAAGYDVSGALADLHATPPDGASLATWGRTRLGSGLSPAELLANSTPDTVIMKNGQTDQPSQVAPRLSLDTGTVTPVGQGTDIYPSRSELAGRTTVGYDPKSGAPIIGPLSTVTPPNLAGGAALSAPSFPNGGRLPTALRNPAAAPAAATGGIVSGAPGPAATAAMAATGDAGAKAFNDITDQGVASKARGAVLDNMLGDTSQFTTGPMADQISKLRAVGQRFGLPVDKDATTASESFNKLAAQLASAQGAGSDARLAVAANANPHSDLSPGGVDMMLRQLRGNEDYIQARSNLAAAYPNKADRAGFEASTGANLDPRVFQYQRMTPEQKGTFLNSMKDPQAFIKAHKWAETNGLVGN